MTTTSIDTTVLKDIVRHNGRLGAASRLRSLPYERCAELSWIVSHLEPRFRTPLDYLDIGTGISPLPTYVLNRSRWNVTCLDKFEWVRRQHEFCARTGGDAARFRVIDRDLLTADLPPESFDVITNISVIEHFEGGTDSEAMRLSAQLLRPGGRYILTTLINENYFREFHLAGSVYGSGFGGKPVFYQRHYDTSSLRSRIVDPSQLRESERVYFGDYGFQCFEKVLQQPKPLRALYMWSIPKLAGHFLKYSPQPVSRPGMRMNTASGVILVLEKPEAMEQ